MAREKNVNRKCKPSLKITYRPLDIEMYCNTCGDKLWEIVTTKGTSAGCKSCKTTAKARKTQDY